MLNGIFVFIVLVSILLAAATGQMQALTDGLLADARRAVEIAIELVGVMAFFLGLMRVAEEGGLLRLICRLAAPVMRRLFPAVPPDHPAMGAMVLNIASNLMGLGNAATPFGIRAMQELDRLNGRRGTATNAMVLFLAINTAGLAILPATTIALRAAAGSTDATGILVPTWIASGSATLVAIIAATALARWKRYRASEPPPAGPADCAESRPDETLSQAAAPVVPAWRRAGQGLLWLAFGALLVRHVALTARELSPYALTREVLSSWMLPAIVLGVTLFGWSRGVRVYEAMVEGAKGGFEVALRIIPFLVTLVVAVGMFRSSGGMGWLVERMAPVTALIGMPAEALPMAILRPLTASGAMAYMTQTMQEHGADSLLGYLVSTYQGSTETTFYVLAVYFGAVGVKVTRHALPACLAADAVGLLVATLAVRALHG